MLALRGFTHLRTILQLWYYLLFSPQSTWTIFRDFYKNAQNGYISFWNSLCSLCYRYDFSKIVFTNVQGLKKYRVVKIMQIALGIVYEKKLRIQLTFQSRRQFHQLQFLKINIYFNFNYYIYFCFYFLIYLFWNIFYITLICYVDTHILYFLFNFIYFSVHTHTHTHHY